MWRGWTVGLACLLSTVSYVHAQGPDEEWQVQDDPDDRSWRPMFLVPELPVDPPSGWSEHLDVRKVTIGEEDETGFAVTIQVEDLTVGTARSSMAWNSCNSQSGEAILVRFQLVAPEPFVYEASLALVGDWVEGEVAKFEASSTTSCLCPGAQYSCPKQRIDVRLDGETDSIRIWIPKASLVGQQPVPDAYGWSGSRVEWPTALPVGTELDEFTITTYSHPPKVPLLPGLSGLAPAVVDTVDPGPKPFQLTHAPANSLIRLRLEENLDSIPVRVDGNQTIAFTIENRADGRRILQLAYEIAGTDDLRAKYEVSGPSRATIPRGESRRFFLALTVAPDAAPTDNVTLSLRATSAGFPGEVGAGQAVLVPGPHLGPDSDTLYIDTKAGDGNYCGTAYYIDPQPCPTPFLTPLKSDPLHMDGAWSPRLGSNGLGGTSGYGNAKTAGRGTPLPVIVNASGTAKVHLVFESDHDLPDLDVTYSFLYGNVTTGDHLPYKLFETTRTEDIVAGTNTVSFDVKTRPTAGPLPRGTHFELALAMEGPPSAGSTINTFQNGFSVKSLDSYVRLPLDELPLALRNEVVESPFQLLAQGSVEDFVNPGESRLFNVTLLNQGGQRYRAQLGARANDPAWEARVLPGSLYDLEPGDTLRLGLLVRAPLESLEGEMAEVRLNVTDAAGHVVELRFRVVVATGIDLGDDTGSYRLDEEASRAAVETAKKDTPGPGAMLALALALAAAGRTRRTRGNGPLKIGP